MSDLLKATPREPSEEWTDREIIEQLVAAWEALPGPSSYSVFETQVWMSGTLKPAFDRARAHLINTD